MPHPMAAWNRYWSRGDTDGMAIFWIGVVPIMATISCLGLSYRYGLGPLAALIPIVGISVFVGMWTDVYEMTSAIAAAITITYLVLLCVSMNGNASTILTAGAAKGLMSQFKTVVQTVIAFYFGQQAITKTVSAVMHKPTAEDEKRAKAAAA